MSLIAFILIFLSATFHASWNLLAKKNHSSVPFYTLICTTSMLIWLHMQFWTPVRLSMVPPRFWLLTFCSTLSDLLYCFGLAHTYKHMEMSSAYPIMRSLPVILTAAVTTLAGIGTTLTAWNYLGFAFVFMGALLMPLEKFSQLRLRNYLTLGLPFVIMTACGTTGYTLFDSLSLGVLRNHLHALQPEIGTVVTTMTYYSTRGLVLCSVLWLTVLCRASDRAIMADFWRTRNYHPVLAGCFASGAYILVLLAMNYVTNVSFVQVFRQIGLPVGMLLSIVFLKEKNVLTKWCGVFFILTGLILSVIR